jgi:hypothetical protein
MRKCYKCQTVIPPIRLEALPDTETCVKCSDEPVRVGFMDWYHKTAPELVIVSGKENLRRAERINNRSR